MQKTTAFLLLLPLMSWSVMGGKYYETSKGFKYYIEDLYQFNWFEAFFECSYRGMTLYTYENQTQFEDLYQLLISDKFALKPPHLWIGAVGVKGKFIWIKTRKPMSANHLWPAGNPDNSGDTEHCLQIWNSKKYINDLTCSRKIGFVCEMDNGYNIERPEGKYKGLNINFYHSNVMYHGSKENK